MRNFLFQLWKQLKLHDLRDDTLSETQLLKIACKISGYGFSKTRRKIIHSVNMNVNFAIDFAKMFPRYHEFVRGNLGIKEHIMLRWLGEFPNDDINVSDFIAHVETSNGAFRLAEHTNTPDTRLAHMITNKDVAVEWVETFEEDIEYMHGVVLSHDDIDIGFAIQWNHMMDQLDKRSCYIYR